MKVAATERVATPNGKDQFDAEAELVARAKREPAAFEPLYRRYVDPVFRYCARALGSREAAEDATSQVFTRAFAALATCRNDAFRPWLFAIAHNAVANARRGARPSAPLEDLDPPDRAPLPDELAIAADEASSLRRLLAALPPGQRDVLELRLAGLTGPEIARALGRTHGSVKIAQVRAFATLRAQLTHQEDPHGQR